MPIQQMLLGAGGAVATKTYVDDVFRTHLYTGNATARSINTGLDMTEGGLVWVKNRDQGYNHSLQDTVRGAGKDKRLSSNLNSAEDGTDLNNYWAGYISSFNNNGFSVDKEGSGSIDWANYNKSGDKYASFNFREAKGFFDVVTYTGNSTSGRTLSHSLGSVPGCIMVKCTSAAFPWRVYHRGVDATSPEDYALRLEAPDQRENESAYWNDTAPTSSVFSLGSHASVNASSHTYVAYVFAGGASDEPGSARSVEFDGSGDYLSSATSSDLSFGTGDYTVEFWFNANSINDSPLFENRVSGVSHDTTGFTLTAHGSTNGVRIWWNGASRINGGGSSLGIKQWHHLAATRSSGTTYLFLNGELLGTTTDSINLTTTEAHIGGGKYSGGTAISHYYDGKISNVRIIKGTALYTSSFRPPTEGLTNITNTKLLCCNKNTVTGSTVTPGTITSNGNPQSSTDTPFDDPAGFVFGDSGTEGIIKCGSFTTDSNGAATIDLGWEPQWVLHKASLASGGWSLIDNMRGWPTEGINTTWFNANSSGAENDSNSNTSITSTGFKVHLSAYWQSMTRIFVAIRRPDGYVGKPPELGTGVFAMDTGAGNSDIPNFDSNFPVDFGILRKPAISQDWFTSARLIEGTYLKPNKPDDQTTYGNYTFDSNVGWVKNTEYNSNYQSWMWKRHAGFDVVTWEGTNGNVFRRHNLGKIPEMIIFKNRDASRSWRVYHKGLNGGTNPEDYEVAINSTSGGGSNTSYMNGTAPTSTHFVSGNDGDTNGIGDSYIALLFASVDGISKCGSYSGSNSTVNVPCGFVPRFVLIKKTNEGGPWVIHDTTRGLVDGNDCYIFLDDDAAQDCNYDTLDLINTGGTANHGFSVPTTGSINDNGDSYIFYAHA